MWFEMLCSCARQLQARADAGEENAQIGNTDTPAAAVLETTHRLLTEASDLRAHQRQHDTKEAALKEKLTRAQNKIDVLLLEKQEKKRPFGVDDATLPAVDGAEPREHQSRVDEIGSHLVKPAE